MDALILAGGKGLRLRPYTTILPKPLLPLGEKPILEYLLLQLKAQGFKHCFLSVGHLSSLIMAYFGTGEKYGIAIEYVEENEPLGTAGSISLLPEQAEPFVVLNGDLVTDLDFKGITEYHVSNNSFLTIGVHKLSYQLPLGYLEVQNGFEITDYIEKPIKIYDVSMGIYVCDPGIKSYLSKNEYLDFPDLAKRLISHKQRVIAYHNDAQWIDVGRPEEYERAMAKFDEGKRHE